MQSTILISLSTKHEEIEILGNRQILMMTFNKSKDAVDERWWKILSRLSSETFFEETLAKSTQAMRIITWKLLLAKWLFTCTAFACDRFYLDWRYNEQESTKVSLAFNAD